VPESILRGYCKAEEKTISQVNNIKANHNSLHHPHVRPPNSANGMLFNVVDNNNIDMDNETATKNDLDISPPGRNKIMDYSEKLLEWLHRYSTPITTMKEVSHVQRISAYLQEVKIGFPLKELTE